MGLKSSLKGKTTVIITGLIGLVACIVILTLPLWTEFTDYNKLLSIAGFIVSTTALIIAIIEVHGMTRSNVAIEQAVKANRDAILKITNVVNITRHAQITHELHGFIVQQKWEMAHLRLLEIYTLLQEILHNHQQYGTQEQEISRIISPVASDLRDLNDAIISGTMIRRDVIMNHLDEISGYLTTLCNNLTNQTNQ